MLSRLSWDDEDRIDPRDSSKSFGLKLAFVTRLIFSFNIYIYHFRTSLEFEDIENRTLEIRSHSAHNVLTLRCTNAMEADAWFEAIHTCAETLLIQALAQVFDILFFLYNMYFRSI